jgi:hypothetical protein
MRGNGDFGLPKIMARKKELGFTGAFDGAYAAAMRSQPD